MTAAATKEKTDETQNINPITVNKDQTYGITYNPDDSYCTLWARQYFAERTRSWSPRGGEVFYEAGTYSPWRLSDRPYPSGKHPVANALSIVAEWLAAAKLHEESRSIFEYADLLRQAKDEIDAHFRGV